MAPAMQTITELDPVLEHLPIESPELALNPYPWFTAARARHPWLARSHFGYVITSYQAMRDLFIQDRYFRLPIRHVVELMGATGTRWGHFMEELFIGKSGEEHRRIRESVASAFRPDNVNRHRALMRSVVATLLDEWAPRARFDFADFAANFPIRVMCGLIGASPEVVPHLRKSLETQGLSFSLDKSLLPAMQAAFEVLWSFVDELIIDRLRHRAERKQDLLDSLIEANTSGRLSDYELRNMLIFLFAAGYDTSKNMLTLIMYDMLKAPEYWQRCAADKDFCARVVEETFRYNSVSNSFRTAVEEYIYRDVRIPTGTNLFIPLGISGRDPASFPDADEYRPERDHANKHIAFGMGVHMCLGHILARAQIQEGVHLIAQRITAPRLAGDIAWRPFQGVWGLLTLPIEFTPRAPGI
jgi:cytochrome P450